LDESSPPREHGSYLRAQEGEDGIIDLNFLEDRRDLLRADSKIPNPVEDSVKVVVTLTSRKRRKSPNRMWYSTTGLEILLTREQTSRRWRLAHRLRCVFVNENNDIRAKIDDASGDTSSSSRLTASNWRRAHRIRRCGCGKLGRECRTVLWRATPTESGPWRFRRTASSWRRARMIARCGCRMPGRGRRTAL